MKISAKKNIQHKFGNREISIQYDVIAKQLCACVLEKFSESKSSSTSTSSVDELLQRMAYGTTQFGMYMMIPFYRHYFPAIYCLPSRGNKDCYLIAKGQHKQSDEKHLYNIYVAKVSKWVDGAPMYHFLGVINNVDLGELFEAGMSKLTPQS